MSALASVIPARHKLLRYREGIPTCRPSIGCKAAMCKQLHLHSLASQTSAVVSMRSLQELSGLPQCDRKGVPLHDTCCVPDLTCRGSYVLPHALHGTTT
jgi:hypothetical protein